MDWDGEDDTPPLLRAAYAGDLHALRRAIADGADLDVEDEDGYTALHWLCMGRPHVYDTVPHFTPDRLACISALLEAGADVNWICLRTSTRSPKRAATNAMSAPTARASPSYSHPNFRASFRVPYLG